MKKTLYFILAVVFILFIIRGFRISYRNLLPENEFRVLILYNPVLHKEQPGILEAYEKVLADEGVPYKSVTPSVILSGSFEKLLESNPVIIIPDSIAEILPKDVGLWFINYIVNGGSVLVVYDVGIKNRQGAYLENPVFSEFLGFNYMNYKRFKELTYTWGYMQFKDSESAEFFGMSGEFLDSDNFLCSYIDGNPEKVKSPVARIEQPENMQEKNIYAYAVIDEQEKYPAVVSADYGKGKLLYVNLPLGYLSVYVNELPLRAVLKTFLFRITEIPRFASLVSR